MQPAIQEGLHALGVSRSLEQAAVAAKALMQTCVVMQAVPVPREWLAHCVAEVELRCEALRLIAGDELVALHKVDGLYRLQQELRQRDAGHDATKD